MASLVAWDLTLSKVRAEQGGGESESCSYLGVIGTPAGVNYTDIQTISDGDISAKVEIRSSPAVGYGKSVTVMARVEIWITNDYDASVKHSAWVDVTGWINSSNCFESGTNTGGGNYVGACPRTGSVAYMGYVNVKSITRTATKIVAELEFSLQESIPISPPGGTPNPGSPFTLSVEAV